jgi:murein DD-endopeptidase MepM/ murein hydrolase activator NlpD
MDATSLALGRGGVRSRWLKAGQAAYAPHAAVPLVHPSAKNGACMEHVTESRSKGFFRSSPSTAFDQYLHDIQKLPLIRDPAEERRLARKTQAAYAKADSARLLSYRLALQKRAFQVGTLRAAAAASVIAAKRKLKAAEKELEKARSSSATSSFAPGATNLLAAPQYQGDYVFPVGGGPSVVSVGHHHHDYPAADIAAPEGSPLYALTAGFIVDAWHMPNGSCGIGLTMRAAGDGREWTYCHMSYEEPGIQPGVAVSAGQPVGLVGHTGHATGPHLHLQLQPATSYPQVEPWFSAFAGSAFRWQDAPTMDAGPVFEVVV